MASIVLERMAHVSSAEVQALVDSRVTERFSAEIREARDEYVSTGDLKECPVEELGADARGRNPYVAVWFSGLVTFRLNSGWGEKAVKDWRIEASSLALLREQARAKGYKVTVKSNRGKKRRATKRPKAVPQEQVPMFGGDS